MNTPLIPDGLEPEDAELQQRLDAAFSRTSPRRGFEDTLWVGLVSGSRPRRRFRLHLPAVVPRRAWPALGAAATVLVVAAAVLPLLLLGHRGGQTGLQRPATAAWFGLLPAPQLSTAPSQSAAGRAAATTTPASAQAGVVPYYGPAQLSIATVAPALPLSLPVFRFSQPSPQQAAAWAGAHGGQVMMQSSGPFREPRIQIVAAGGATAGAPPAEAQALAAAKAFLADHKLARWPHEPEVAEQGDLALVRYTRRFQVKSYGPAPQVDPSGAHAGADVEVRPDGKVAEATVPMDMPMQSVAYTSRAGDQAAKDAVGSAPASQSGLTPLPTVQLSKASLVYIAVADGSFGYFEPALLFTGLFTSDGTRYEKRVLVPALDATQLRH